MPTQTQLEVKNLIILVRLTDGSIRQILLDEYAQYAAINGVRMTLKDGVLKVCDPPIDYISWPDVIDLTKHK